MTGVIVPEIRCEQCEAVTPHEANLDEVRMTFTCTKCGRVTP